MTTYPRDGWTLMTAIIGGEPVAEQPTEFDSETHYNQPVRSPDGKTVCPWYPPLTAAPKPRALSRFEFLSLFSGDKIDAALALKPTTLARFWAFYEAAEAFERDHMATTLGLDALEAAEVIDGQYRAAVLAAWPTN